MHKNKYLEVLNQSSNQVTKIHQNHHDRCAKIYILGKEMGMAVVSYDTQCPNRHTPTRHISLRFSFVKTVLSFVNQGITEHTQSLVNFSVMLFLLVTFPSYFSAIAK